jgi:hypothetical protein
LVRVIVRLPEGTVITTGDQPEFGLKGLQVASTVPQV